MVKKHTNKRTDLMVIMPMKNIEVSVNDIRERAYNIYLKKGGDEKENWIKAEKELKNNEISSQHLNF